MYPVSLISPKTTNCPDHLLVSWSSFQSFSDWKPFVRNFPSQFDSDIYWRLWPRLVFKGPPSASKFPKSWPRLRRSCCPPLRRRLSPACSKIRSRVLRKARLQRPSWPNTSETKALPPRLHSGRPWLPTSIASIGHRCRG